MNICFIIGKIVSDVEFKFVLESKHTSIVIFKLELSNCSIVTVKTYDEIADSCYQKLQKGDIIGIKGYLNSNMEIIVEEIEWLLVRPKHILLQKFII